MPLWSDNFDRADGPLGGNWTAVLGSLSIVSNGVNSGGAGTYAAGPVTCPGSAVAEVTIDWAADPSNHVWPAVKIDPSSGTGYFGYVVVGSGVQNFQLYSFSGGSNNYLTTYAWTGSFGSSGTLRLTWGSGQLSLYYNGVLMISSSNSTYAANNRVGLRSIGTGGHILAFTGSGDGSPQLIISPRVVGTDDGDQLLSILGVAVTWTPGTPGSPVFTVNSGALSSQQITSTSNASAVFSPPLTPGTVTLTDPANAISATITVVSGTYVGGSGVGGGVIPSSVVDWLTLQANHGGLVLSDIDALTGAPAPDKIKKTLGDFYLWLASLLGEVPSSPPETPVASTLWRLINGGYYSEVGPFPEPSFTTLDAGLGTIDGKLNTLVTDANWNLAELLFSLGGNPVKSHQDIIDALGSLGGGSNTEVLDAIAAARGDTTTSLATLLSSLAGIRTTDAYSLGDVKDWVDALPHGETGPTALAVAAAVAAIGAAIVTGGAAIPVEAVAIGAGPLLDMATLVEVASIIGELAGIASNIASIRASLSAPVATGAPLWPGLSDRTLGTSSALGASGTISEAMDGVIVSIDHCDTDHRPAYIYDGFRSWANIGQLVFLNDDGSADERQSFNFEKQVYTPRSFRQASAVRWYTGHGPVGTIRAWTITP